MEVSEKEKGWIKVKTLREIHQPVLEALGVSGAVFLPKMFYTPIGKDELHVSFFKNELQRGKDIYTEMVDRSYNSEDEKRTLYRWVFNELWATQYEVTSTQPVRYLIPVSELEKVKSTDILHHVALKEPVKAPANLEEELIGCSDLDCELSHMTMRDLVAIYMKKPVSLKPWLNAVIKGEI